MILCKTITHELKLQMRYWRKVYNILSPRRTCSSHIENWTKICEIPFLMYEWWSWIIISYIGMLCCGILSSTNSNHTEQQQWILWKIQEYWKTEECLPERIVNPTPLFDTEIFPFCPRYSYNMYRGRKYLTLKRFRTLEQTHMAHHKPNAVSERFYGFEGISIENLLWTTTQDQRNL